ncbi:hypothetical protein OG2516_04306 [Oceanicola granulosus HTCC2516]|uniref:Uncharacterized protein n=1 Tax=Oceanicola granulosus (strain ATCC BAA-861 / DSM 15982 / KCTC 12143 / HTCC2516) TaxID=314256 RepID=Q2CA58_OCEGH|nr:hypothetical protein [Oceanicola granulosus]EAR49554.1 hypothetical protein OG2516_04306 [Oceanicola granulosus HTCC2516]
MSRPEPERDPDREAWDLLIHEREQLLRATGETLAEMVERLRGGEGGDFRKMVSKAGDVEFALRKMIEIREKYDDWHAKRGGELTGNRFDADDARADIGRKLDRLRDAGGAGGVS